MNCPDCGKFTKKQIWDHPPVPAHVVWWCKSCGWGYAEIEDEVCVLPPDTFKEEPFSVDYIQKIEEIGKLDVVDIPIVAEKCTCGARRH